MENESAGVYSCLFLHIHLNLLLVYPVPTSGTLSHICLVPALYLPTCPIDFQMCAHIRSAQVRWARACAPIDYLRCMVHLRAYALRPRPIVVYQYLHAHTLCPYYSFLEHMFPCRFPSFTSDVPSCPIDLQMCAHIPSAHVRGACVCVPIVHLRCIIMYILFNHPKRHFTSTLCPCMTYFLMPVILRHMHDSRACICPPPSSDSPIPISPCTYPLPLLLASITHVSV
jgi:hypothetical protein